MSLSSLRPRLQELLPAWAAVRHELHRYPELGFAEHRTQKLVMNRLRELGYTPRKCAETGVLADLRDGDVAPRIALRADLDALPIHETTDLPYRSQNDGVSHKCGHDGHTTILLGVAELLASVRDELPGNVRLVFQPAEEGVRGGGAKVMVAEGALDGVAEIYGLHNWPGFPKGDVRVQGGPVMAQVDSFVIRLHGVGGHGSTPERCRDPIVAGAQVVTALQSVIARGIGALETGVVSIGAFQAGNADNVIPGVAELRGTIRSLGGPTAERVHARIREVVDGVAKGMGVRPELELFPHYPVLQNHPACAAAVLRAAKSEFGADPEDRGVHGADGLPLLASEDFAFFTQNVPGAYFFLGAGVPGADTPGCHHPDFDFDDDLIERGVRMFLGILADRFSAGVGLSSETDRQRPADLG